MEVDTLYLLNSLEVVKSVTQNCQRCQWLRGRPFEVSAASLPQDRVDNPDHLLFQHVGIDLFGSLHVGEPPTPSRWTFTIKIDSENGTTVKGKKGWDILHYLLCLARMTVFNEHECVCTIPEDYSGWPIVDGFSSME